jgi:hypothetical protein
MKSRNLVFLAIIVVILGAYVLFYERHQMTTEEQAEQTDMVFPGLDRDRVVAVDIRNTHGEFRIEKRGDDWRLVTPIDFPADSTAVGSMLSSVVNLKEQRRLEAGEVEPAAYGLDRPELSVKLTTEDDRIVELLVGDKTPLGSNRAIQVSGDAGIILCSEFFVADIDKELADWRSRDLVDVAATDVASLQVVAGGDRIHAIRQGDAWRLLEPLEDVADTDHMRNLVQDLNNVRIEEFLDGAADQVELGLDAPSYRITIVRSDGADPVRLDFGAINEEGGSTRVACRRDDNEYFWVSDAAATRLAKAPVRWRSAKVYSFNTWDAEALTISAGGSTMTLERSEGLWRLTDGGELDHTAVQDRLTALADLEALEYDLVDPGTEEMGRVGLAIKGGAGSEEAEQVRIEYVFHRPFTDGGDAVAVVSNRGSVMSVDSAKVAEILADPELLRKQEPEPELDEPTN